MAVGFVTEPKDKSRTQVPPVEEARTCPRDRQKSLLFIWQRVHASSTGAVVGRRSEPGKPVVSRCILIEVLLLEECELGEGLLLMRVFAWRRGACLWFPFPRRIPGFSVPENCFDHIFLSG